MENSKYSVTSRAQLFGFLQPWGINPSRAQAIYLSFCSLGELTPRLRELTASYAIKATQCQENGLRP